MAAAVVHSKQTGSGSVTTLAITAATAGNLLVVFGNQSGNTETAIISDNISSTAGWTVQATKALYNASGSSLYVATKIAVGGETTLTIANTGGMSYFEVSGLGASPTLDGSVVAVSNTASAKTNSITATTTDAGSIILACIANTLGSGVVSAWTGTGPMTNTETSNTRNVGGSYIPGTTVSGGTFTANWETARASGGLLIAMKPTAAGGSGAQVAVV